MLVAAVAGKVVELGAEAAWKVVVIGDDPLAGLSCTDRTGASNKIPLHNSRLAADTEKGPRLAVASSVPLVAY